MYSRRATLSPSLIFLSYFKVSEFILNTPIPTSALMFSWPFPTILVICAEMSFRKLLEEDTSETSCMTRSAKPTTVWITNSFIVTSIAQTETHYFPMLILNLTSSNCDSTFHFLGLYFSNSICCCSSISIVILTLLIYFFNFGVRANQQVIPECELWQYSTNLLSTQ